jgi:hypothetical protein
MKTVRYLAGVAGLAPAAFGMVTVPQNAYAAVTGHEATGSAKTVSLHQVLGSGASATKDCTGTTAFTFPTEGRIRGHGYYAYEDDYAKFCIGTVVDSTEFYQTSCHDVWGITTGYYAGSGSIKIHDVCGHRTAGDEPEWFSTNFVFRNSWVEPGCASALDTQSSWFTYKCF